MGDGKGAESKHAGKLVKERTTTPKSIFYFQQEKSTRFDSFHKANAREVDIWYVFGIFFLLEGGKKR